MRLALPSGMTTEGRAPHTVQLASRARTDSDEDLAAWRWRNYTDHLCDLGYDLDGGGAPEDVGRAISAHRERARRA